MGFVAWRAIRAVILAAIVGAIAWGIDGLASGPLRAGETGKYFTIPGADVRVTLNEDASLTVVEDLEFDFHGPFSGAYRDIPLRQGARITHLDVIEDDERYRPGGNTALGSFDEPGTFGTVDFPGSFETPDGLRAVWHYSATNEKRTFRVRYQVTGAAVAYDDVIDVGWFVWGDQWQFWLDRLDASIAARSGAAPTHAWVEPRWRGVEPELTDSQAVAEIEKVPNGEPTLLRAVFPRDAVADVSAARVVDGDGLEKIEAEEQRLDDEYGSFDKAKNFAANNIVLLSGIWTGLLLLLAIPLYIRGRDLPTSTGEYVPEPPEEIPPALAYAYATEGEYDDRIVLATLLHLIDRGYYDSSPTQGSGDDDLDLEIAVAADRPGEELEDYEVATLDFFDRLLGNETVALGKLKDEIPEHSSSWRGRWKSLNDALDQAEEGKLGWESDLTPWRAWLGTIAFIGYLVIAILYFVRTHDIAIPAAATALGLLWIFALPASWLKRLDPPSRERNAQWAAFERWTDDFPRLDDDPPATLKLWRQILVYAVAFGTAEKVIRSGRIPESVFAEAESSAGWIYAGHYSGGHFAGSFDGFSSGFSSQVAPESSSSGGGGFSGGGGGSSGGGGGGAW